MRRQDINRVVVVTNPVSTRHEVIRPRIDDIKQHFGHQVVELESFPEPTDTTDLLKDTLRHNDLVVTAGGDGTARTAVEALADPTVPAHRATLLPLPGGYRNDLARQLHGARHLHRPSQLIKDSAAVNILPLRTSFQFERGSEQRLSALYTGIGAMAAAADYISSPEFRSRPGYHNPLVRELHGLSILPWALKNTQNIAVQDDAGNERSVYDIMLVNAPVVAQYLHPPVNLLDDEAFYAELPSKRPHHVVSYLGRLMAQPYLKPPVHQMVRPGQDIGFTLREPTYVHMDGDAEVLPEGVHIGFGLHTIAFQALCSRPRRVMQYASNAPERPGWLSDWAFPLRPAV